MDETEGFQCLEHSNWIICSPLSPFCSEIFSTFSLSYWGALSYYPRGLIIGKGNSPNPQYGWDWGVSVPGAFKLDHLQPFKPILFRIFSIFSPLYWDAHSYYPRGLIVRKRNNPTPELNDTKGFECLGHLNWTICSPLSPFCSGNFQFFSPLYWEANSYYPRGLIVRKRSNPTPELNDTQGFECLRHLNIIICSPLSPFCSGYFQFFHLYIGMPILITPEV